jgi:hypothetical protein
MAGWLDAPGVDIRAELFALATHEAVELA